MDSGDSIHPTQLNSHTHYFAFRDDGEEDRSSAVLRQSRVDARNGRQHSLTADHNGLNDDDDDDEKGRGGSSSSSSTAGLLPRDDSGCPACCQVDLVCHQPLILRLSALWSGCQRQVLRHHLPVLVSFVSLSFMLVALLSHYNSFAASTALSSSPPPFTCHDVLWIDGVGCGLMGRDCLPFTSSSPLIVRCAARCDYYPYYQQRLTGTAPYYRADSYVCTAAIHAGAIGSSGGCAAVLFTGSRALYNASTQNGLSSRSADTWFPRSFTLLPAEGAAHCSYFHWWTLAVGLLLLSLLCLLRPHAGLLYLCLLLWGYWYTASSMDDGHTQEQIFFIMTERIFYVCAAAYPMFFLGPRVTLSARDSSNQQPEDEPQLDYQQQQEQQQDGLGDSEPQPWRSSLSPSLLWRPCLRWLQAYDGAAFTLHLASSRPAPWYELCFLYTLPFVICLHWGYLTLVLPDIDLNAQAFQHGDRGLLVMAVVSIVVLLLVLSQLRLVYAAGLMRRYLLGYGCLAAVFLLVSVVWRSGYSFHLHHVLIGPLLLPLTRFRTRTSMLCQAIALGLFINGFALWGFASEWDHTGGDDDGGGGDPIDHEPPRSVLAVNVTESSAVLLWEWRNDTGSAVGSVGFLNDVVLAFRSSWQDTQRWRNGSTAGADSDLWGAAAAAVPPHLPPPPEPGVFTLSEGHARHFSAEVALRLGVVDGVSSRRLGVRSGAEAGYETRLSAQLGNDDVRDVAVLRLQGLLANLSYYLSVCYVFTYGVIGPCSWPILIDTRLHINGSQQQLPT